MSERNVRITMIVVDLFLVVSAFAGALGLLVGFMNIPLSVLDRTVFTDFTVPALLLGVVVGGSALAAAVIALAQPRSPALLGPWRVDALATAVAGCVAVGWMVIEVALIGLDSWLQPTYLIVGLAMIGLAGLLQWTETRSTERKTAVIDRRHAPAA
jgi:hypothetical protein